MVRDEEHNKSSYLSKAKNLTPPTKDNYKQINTAHAYLSGYCGTSYCICAGMRRLDGCHWAAKCKVGAGQQQCLFPSEIQYLCCPKM